MTDAGGWDFSAEPASTGPGVVTLVEGSSFCVGGRRGDFRPGGTEGLFFRDTRIVSEWSLRLDGAALEPLAVMEPQPFEALFLARTAPRPGEAGDEGQAESTMLVERRRRVGRGMREDVVVHNLAPQPRSVRLRLRLDADFADVFEVKEGRVRGRAPGAVEASAGRVTLRHPERGSGRGVVVRAPGWERWEEDRRPHLVRAGEVPAGGSWRTSIEVCPVVDDAELTPLFSARADPAGAETPGAARARAWREALPVVDTDHPALGLALETCGRDLGALRIFDPHDPDGLPAVAAGAPWFMALFGRDSLLAAYLTLLFDQRLALGTLRMLARHQGRRTDPLTEEQPGRILHEVRFGVDARLALGGGGTYYGTADATPLFVVLLGELARWGLPEADLRELVPSADRALDWVAGPGDPDGDGFVEYRRTSQRGLVNQGWKDSWDGVSFADGRLAQPPIALAEVQGYVYAAHRGRAALAVALGDRAAAERHEAAAERVKDRFNESFWLPGAGYYAMALDGDKRPVDALASNMGHCLWSGVVDPDRAGQVVERLMSPELFSGWGVRTLAEGMGRYNPMSYHNGSVWPHDNALVVAGMTRYGFRAEAGTVALALVEAARSFGGRLPELFCGFPRARYPEPVPYPASCSPQAWASATPVQLLRSLLGAEPADDGSGLTLRPALPAPLGEVRLRNLPVGDRRVGLLARRDRAQLLLAPPGEARP